MSRTPLSIEIYDSVWKLSGNLAFNCFKISAPGSKDATDVLDHVGDEYKGQIREAGGRMNVFVITADYLKWSKQNGKKGGRSKKVTACVLCSSDYNLYRINPLLEEEKLASMLISQNTRRDSSIESAVFSCSSVVANWRLGQSCLLSEPNVAVALVGSKATLDTEIINRKTSHEVDEAILIFPVPLEYIINAVNDVEPLLEYSKREMATLIVGFEDTTVFKQLGSFISSLTVEHHLNMCIAMTNQWCKHGFPQPEKNLHMLIIVQQSQYGAWIDIPGGKRDLAESTEVAAFREFREETGISILGRCHQTYSGCPNRRLAKFGPTCKLILAEMGSESESDSVETELANLKIS